LNTDETRKLKFASENQSLPDKVQALFFVCDCFGLGEKELELGRMKLNRARSGKDISNEERERVYQRLIISVHKAAQTPVSRCTFVTDDILSSLITIYESPPLWLEDRKSVV
jgi:hypothetical protein